MGTNVPMSVWCNGYARGYADAFIFWKVAEPKTAKVCIPDKTHTAVLVLAVTRYINGHPESRQAPIGALVAIALLEAWSC